MDKLTGRLRRFIRKRVANQEDAEDVIQDAYLRVLRYSAEHEVQSQERLLFSAAKNLAVDIRRRQWARAKNVADYAVLEVYAQDVPAVDEVVYSRERLRKVETMVAQLPPRCREVFLLHRIDGMSYSQIAKHCGISVSAVEKHIARACLLIDTMIHREDDT